jgi:hypothetical protein
MTFAEKIAAGNIGISEVEIERMTGCDTVKCIKFHHFFMLKRVDDKTLGIKIKLG